MGMLFVVDARSRDLATFVASATNVESDPESQQLLVLRKGVEISPLCALDGRVLDSPVFVAGQYQARSSAGFTGLLYPQAGYPAVWIGGAGFGVEVRDEESQASVRRGDALRPFGYPIRGTLLPAGRRVEAVLTHGNSNSSTAEAALEGLRLRAEVEACPYLVEGQSDCTRAWAFRQFKADAPPDPIFPPEHRAEMFTPERLLRAALMRLAHKEWARRWEAGDTMPEVEEVYKTYLGFAATDEAWVGRYLPPTVIEIIGAERLAELAGRLLEPSPTPTSSGEEVAEA